MNPNRQHPEIMKVFCNFLIFVTEEEELCHLYVMVTNDNGESTRSEVTQVLLLELIISTSPISWEWKKSFPHYLRNTFKKYKIMFNWCIRITNSQMK